MLIHAATGGTGQAAVQIAQQVGAEVYGTASEWKWDTLRALGVKHIYNSRNLDFATEIMQDTNGEGVDIVLNSLTGPGFIEKNLSILAKNGRFLEISKRNVWTNQEIKQVRPDVSYWLADLREIVMKKPEVIATLWKQLTPLFNNGYLKPLAYTAYTLEDVAEAFKTMQQGKHTGKIVITAPTRVTEFRPEATYLITGGLKGLGLLVARWMIEKGVRHLVLAGRSEPDDVAKKEIADLETNGASITILKADISQFNQVKHLLNTIAETHPPLAGIIHSAGLLADGILQQQTWQNFEIVLAPKVQGSWYLHQLTQDRNLDFFILFSSIASLLGSAGQANHAAANAFLDALAHYRQTQGLVGLSINWGAWSEIGAFARRQLDDHLAQKGLGVISPQAGLAVLENLFWQSATQIGVIPINWSQYLNTSIQSPFFSNMLSQDRTTEKTDNTQKQFMVQLETTPITQRLPLLSNYVQSQVAKVLGWSSSQPLDSQQGFFEMGLDSLTSVELRNKLQSGLNCKLRSTIILDYPSVASLTDYLAHKVLTSLFVDDTKDEDKHPTTNTSLEPEADLENLSEAELANLLAEELEML